MNTSTDHDRFALTAISAVDGRYRDKTMPLASLFSEFGLIRLRVLIEIRWFLFLSAQPDIREIPALTVEQQAHIRRIADAFTIEDALAIKNIEKTTNHDLKAVEYFLKERFSEDDTLHPYLEFIHFACTSEDINNLAYGLMLRTARDEVLLPSMRALLSTLCALANAHTETPMMARILWSTRKTVVPLSTICLIREAHRSVSVLFIPAKGSSSIRSLGSVARAMPMPKSFWSP